MNIGITFTNVPERRVYLFNLLEQLSHEYPELSPVVFTSGSLSLFENIHRCFCWLATCKGACLYLQEDVVLCDNFAALLARHIKRHHKDVSYIYYNKPGKPPVVNLRKVGGGECGVLAESRVFSRYTRWAKRVGVEGRKTKHDVFFGGFLTASNFKVCAPIPSLVQHVGGYSAKFSVNVDLKGRQSPTYGK